MHSVDAPALQKKNSPKLIELVHSLGWNQTCVQQFPVLNASAALAHWYPPD